MMLACVVASTLLDRTERPRSDRHDLARPVGETTGTDAGTGRAAGFGAFNRLLASSTGTGIRETPELLDLVKTRHALMLHLMETDPAEALRQSVSFSIYHQLPESLQRWVEEPFSSPVESVVLPICDAPDGIHRKLVEIRFPEEDTVWRMSPVGAGETISNRNVALAQGIRLNGWVALHEGTATPVPDADREWVERAFPAVQPDLQRSFLTGAPAEENPVVALMGGKRIVLRDEAELDLLNKRAAWLDSLPGPDGGSSLLLAMPFPEDGAAGIDWQEIERSALEISNEWTGTPLDVFVIRVDFSDRTNAAFPLPSAATLEAVFNQDANNHFTAMSYGKTGIQATVATAITRMPSRTTTYTPLTSGSSRNDRLHNEAVSTYPKSNPGWKASDYDVVVVYFDSIGMRASGITYAGLAGGSRMWLQGNASEFVVTHELGHNYGLGHSSLWVPPPGSQNPVDPGGSNDEYGDVYDVMGSGDLPGGHFNAKAKVYLNWLDAGDWVDATAAGGGRFRIHRLDDPDASGVRGVRVTKGPDEYYWLAHRRAFDNESLDYGAYLQWERPGGERSWLIDTTPDSQPGSDDVLDAGLALGATYSDSSANLHITALGRGGQATEEWLDVQVELGPFPGNQNPVATLSAPMTAAVRRTVIISVAATDPDGDTLAYDWTIDGIRQQENHPSLAYAWQGAGSSTVKVTVSDGKGGKTTLSQVIQLSESLETWNVRTTGRSIDWKAAASNGQRVVLVGSNGKVQPYAWAWAWSADGVSWTTGNMASNQYLEDLVHDGTQFIAVGRDYDHAISRWVGLIRTSSDGATWTDRRRAGPPLQAVALGNGIRLAGGEDGALLRSTDGLNWSPVTSPVAAGSRIAGLAFGGGVFVMTAHLFNAAINTYNGNHQVWTSTDGLVWTDRTSGTVLDSWTDLRRIEWLGDRFIASGWYSGVLTSTNGGASFEPVITETVEFPGLAQGSGIWLGAGLSRPSASPTIRVSSNGTDWSALDVSPPTGMNAAVAHGNSFLIVGDNDLIWQSSPVESAAAEYPEWRRFHFPDRDAGGRDAADSDFDSLPNLMEYGLGGSPIDGSAPQGVSLKPMPLTNAAHPLLAGRLVLSFSLPDPAPADVRYTVEIGSDDLTTWSALARKDGTAGWAWLAEGSSRIVSTPATGRIATSIGTPEPITGDSTKFMRLKVEIRPHP